MQIINDYSIVSDLRPSRYRHPPSVIFQYFTQSSTSSPVLDEGLHAARAFLFFATSSLCVVYAHAIRIRLLIRAYVILVSVHYVPARSTYILDSAFIPCDHKKASIEGEGKYQGAS